MYKEFEYVATDGINYEILAEAHIERDGPFNQVVIDEYKVYKPGQNRPFIVDGEFADGNMDEELLEEIENEIFSQDYTVTADDFYN